MGVQSHELPGNYFEPHSGLIKQTLPGLNKVTLTVEPVQEPVQVSVTKEKVQGGVLLDSATIANNHVVRIKEQNTRRPVVQTAAGPVA